MPRNKVYGKRTNNVYSDFAGFISPIKRRKEPVVVDVLEVAEELERLTVHDKSSRALEKTSAPSRPPLVARDSNTSETPKHAHAHSPPTEGQTRNIEEPECIEPQPTIVRRSTEKDRKKTKRTKKTVTTLEPRAPVEEQSTVATSLRELEDALPSYENTPSVPDISVPEEAPLQVSNIFTKHTSSLLSLSSQSLESFDAWSAQLSSHFAVAKIAEASFGEVYRMSLLRPHPTLGRADESVLKIIALKPPPAVKRKMSKAAKKRTDMMSSPEDVASEVRLMQRMTTIPGYTMFRDCCILQGRPGASFVSAWRSWNESQKVKGKEASVFPDPGKKASYTDDQLWAVIEMQGKHVYLHIRVPL